MSPEIFKNKPYSFKSDIWALGCVLYEMTTLNHAFDANSLNGLATKIVKGKYPPIHSKYSRYLRELIGQMLLINPQQRPDLDQILRKPFIKKHIVNFFTDIASRPSNSLGEGTMIMKAAAGGPVHSSVGNDTNMISLQKQLHSLDMNEALSEALKPKSTPVDDDEAIKLAKEQASALKREQEHKKMVEAALEKLRVERESRMKDKRDGPGLNRPAGYPPSKPPNSNQPFVRKEEPKPVPPSNVKPVQPQRVNSQVEIARERERGINWNKKNDDDNSVNSNARRDRNISEIPPYNANADKGKEPVGVNRDAGGRRRTFGEDRDSIIEREKKASEDRRKAMQQQLEVEAAKQRLEDRKREEVRQEARAREEARLREEAKQREEAAARQQRADNLKNQQDLAARREREKDKERNRQREEIEQLKRDKLELDRRALERDKLREERRAQERSRLEGAAADKREYQMDAVQEKLQVMNDQLQKLEVKNRRNGSFAADDKSEAENITAKDKVYLRRQEKQAKEEAARLEALREAEAENRLWICYS